MTWAIPKSTPIAVTGPTVAGASASVMNMIYHATRAIFLNGTGLDRAFDFPVLEDSDRSNLGEG